MNNFVKRSITGTCFAALMISSFLFNKYLFGLVSLVVLVILMAEFFRMTMGEHYKISRLLTIFAGCILFFLTYLYKGFNIPGRFVMIAFLPIFGVMINSLYVRDKKDFGKFANLYTAVVYLALPLALSNFTVFNESGEFNGLLLLSIYLIIWSTDVGGYFFGITLGQKFGKKLMPDVSPKKSWVGYWGSLITAILMSIILYYTNIMKFELLHCVILGILINISGVYGDLVESQWKRYYAIKDTGKIMPGHGGFLDRFDSALFAIPIAVIYLIILDLL